MCDLVLRRKRPKFKSGPTVHLYRTGLIERTADEENSKIPHAVRTKFLWCFLHERTDRSVRICCDVLRPPNLPFVRCLLARCIGTFRSLHAFHLPRRLITSNVKYHRKCRVTHASLLFTIHYSGHVGFPAGTCICTTNGGRVHYQTLSGTQLAFVMHH